ncbi:hypothetical protein [Kyrpidia sp.]|uniref:hypothetical protein n=1 Tax=Kyrpidia sp. TaxID=2073077 RepID=UPI00258B13B4|nr:hypothetical protein [Kyrpidia sp.]MCL6575560.1 hypothetical protein [Kyrpidia sp.]
MKQFDLYNQYLNGNATVEQVIEGWNDYMASVYATEVQPIVQRLEDARKAYLNAVLDLQEKRREYAQLRNQVSEWSKTFKVNGAHLYIRDVVEDAQVKYLTGAELVGVQDGNLPADVQRVRG